MISEKDAFSIVVLGAMNPPIHHPQWYAEVGILTQVEADQALRSPGFTCAADATELVFGAVHLRCSRSRWSLGTTRVDMVERMLDIAVSTHDRLHDTPVTGFGLNFDCVREVSGPDALAVLVHVAQSAPLGLLPDGALGAAIRYRRRFGDGVVTVVINPVDSPRHMEVKNNYHQELVAVGQVKLGALIRGVFPIARNEAEAQIARTLAALGQAGRA
jgi:hypothetical protein